MSNNGRAVTIFLSFLISLATLTLSLSPATLSHFLPPCDFEDSTGTVCFWDASSRGNGQGQSFIVVGKSVYYL